MAPHRTSTGAVAASPTIGDNFSTKLSLCTLHFVLAVSSGWALKHSTGPGPGPDLAAYAYGLFFGHSVLCLLRHTHPNPGQVSRVLCTESSRYAPVVFVTLIIGQLQQIKGGGQFAGAEDWLYIVLGMYASLMTLVAIKCCGPKGSIIVLLKRMEAANLGMCVLWNVYCLWSIARNDEYWWCMGLALLVLLNHFVLWRLTKHFNISQLEVSTVGMCFSVIFALNAIQELIEDETS